MNQGKHFCSNCGQPVDERARFCANCGAEIASAQVQQNAPPPIYQPPPAYQAPPAYQQSPVYPAPNYPPPPVYNAPPVYTPQPAPSPAYGYQVPTPGIPGEGIIGVIPNASRKKNLISMETFNIIISNQRLVFAQVTSQMVKDAAASHRGEGVGGFFAAMGSGYTLWERYLQMPPEQALHENPNNFAVYLNQIRKVKYSGGKVLFSKGVVSVGFNVGVGFNNNNDNDNAKLEIDTVGGKYNFEIAPQFQQQTAQVLKKVGLIK